MKEQIKLIGDEVRTQFQTLGLYVFNGEGDENEVIKCFTEVYEAYERARTICKDSGKMHEIVIHMCLFPIEDVDESELAAAYSIAKAQGFLPPPLMERMPDFTMHMNSFFLTIQKIKKQTI